MPALATAARTACLVDFVALLVQPACQASHGVRLTAALGETHLRARCRALPSPRWTLHPTHAKQRANNNGKPKFCKNRVPVCFGCLCHDGGQEDAKSKPEVWKCCKQASWFAHKFDLKLSAVTHMHCAAASLPVCSRWRSEPARCRALALFIAVGSLSLVCCFIRPPPCGLLQRRAVLGTLEAALLSIARPRCGIASRLLSLNVLQQRCLLFSLLVFFAVAASLRRPIHPRLSDAILPSGRRQMRPERALHVLLCALRRFVDPVTHFWCPALTSGTFFAMQTI